MPSLPLKLLLRFIFGIVNAVDVTEDLCNSDCLVLRSSVDSIKAAFPSLPCLCPSSSMCVSFLMFRLMVLNLFCMSIEKQFLPVKNHTLHILWRDSAGLSVYHICLTFLKTLGCLTTGVFYLFNPQNVPKNIGSNHTSVVLRVLTSLAGKGSLRKPTCFVVIL